MILKNAIIQIFWSVFSLISKVRLIFSSFINFSVISISWYKPWHRVSHNIEVLDLAAISGKVCVVQVSSVNQVWFFSTENVCQLLSLVRVEESQVGTSMTNQEERIMEGHFVKGFYQCCWSSLIYSVINNSSWLFQKDLLYIFIISFTFIFFILIFTCYCIYFFLQSIVFDLKIWRVIDALKILLDLDFSLKDSCFPPLKYTKKINKRNDRNSIEFILK